MTYRRQNDGLITMAHGSGGRATAELIEQVFRCKFSNIHLDQMEDGASLPWQKGCDIVMATDSHVVTPLFYPGGNIGTLAVNGTLNDVAMAGGRCRFISAAFILEEGFALADLHRIADSMAEAATQAGVMIVTGDTKVVERGSGDGVFICTTGIGERFPRRMPGIRGIRPGDHILLSGDLGRHGATITALRKGLQFDTDLASDCEDLTPLVEAMLNSAANIRCLRDPTRGGMAAVLNEWAAQTGLSISINEADMPSNPTVASLCELLGLDPFYLASEGRLLCVCDPANASELLKVMQQHPSGKKAALIGVVAEKPAALVQIVTHYGGKCLLDWRYGDPLPRIC
jgi:hydrogenase expression/formation protein HypE